MFSRKSKKSLLNSKSIQNQNQSIIVINPFNPKLIMQVLPTIREENDWVRGSEKLFNQLSSEQTIYCQILHTVWYISGERLEEKIEVDHSWEWKG